MKIDKYPRGTFYLSCFMRPAADYNFPMFEKWSGILRSVGMTIVSPHEYGDPAKSRGTLMTEDLQMILDRCDGIIVMPGWESSPGANAEVAVAFATEKPVYELVIREPFWDLVPARFAAVTVVSEDQYAKKLPLIGLCGYAQSGKDTTASIMVDKLHFTRVAFADTLRDVLYALNPPVSDEDDIITTDVQELVDSIGWDAAKVDYPCIRRMLQRLGTEAGRDILDPNLWVREGEKKIELARGPVVVTDCRFPNEMQMIRRRKGTLIWVNRPGVHAANSHASEHSVSQQDCDYVLENDGTIEDLAVKILHAEWNPMNNLDTARNNPDLFRPGHGEPHPGDRVAVIETDPMRLEGTFEEIAQECYDTALDHGWHDAPEKTFGECIALAHSELSESLEHYREGHALDEVWLDAETGKPDGVPVELADVIIRIMDTAIMFGMDLSAAMRQKMDYNKTRPYRHGGKVV